MMRRSVFLVLGVISMVLTGCQPTRHQHMASTPTTYSHKEINRRVAAPMKISGNMDGRATLGDPHEIPAMAYVMTPFSLEVEQEAWDRNASHGASASRYHAQTSKDNFLEKIIYPSPRSVMWHNAFFTNLETLESHKLLDERKPIVGYWYPRLFEPSPEDPDKQVPVAPPFLLFEIADYDTNDNQLLDPRDAQRVYLSNADGTDIKAITPKYTQASNYVYRKDQGMLLIAVIHDVNQDGIYRLGDNVIWYCYKIGQEGPAQPLVNAELVKEATQLLREPQSPFNP